MAVKFLADYSINISFLEWMYYTVPFTSIFLVIAWFILTVIYKPDVEKLKVRGYYHRLTTEQKRVLMIFATTVFLWLTAGIHKVSISLVALVPIFLFYIMKLFESKDFGNFHWDILILIGGGLSLGAAISSSGLSIIMADILKVLVGGHHLILTLFLTSLFCILMTMFSSNTGTASFIIPTIFPLAAALGIDPKLMVILAGVSVSLDFLVPIGTPPNAIAYSTGYIHIKDMIKAGAILGIIGAFLLSLLSWLYW
jgi:sodium-dependent dicarboxylate transporter 2/3/5